MTKDNRTCVVFSAGWDFISQDMGICFIPDDNPARWLRMDRIFYYNKLDKYWYLIFPEFGYFSNSLNIDPTIDAKDTSKYIRHMLSSTIKN
jgi:hypothetical protein